MGAMPTILVLHGPNMTLKGVAAVDEALEARASELGLELFIVQSNSEGVLLDALIEQRAEVAGVIVNPGVLAPSSWALAEALALLEKPSVEVLLDNATRGPSALTGVVSHQVHDQGVNGYVLALERLAKAVPLPAEPAEQPEAPEDAAEAHAFAVSGKTIGRKRPVTDAAASGPPRAQKTIGRKAAPPPSSPTGAPSTSTATASASANTRAAPAGLSREQVRTRLSARLGGTLPSEALATWARGEWAALQRGGPCEEGQRELLDSVLLTLMASSRASEHVLLAQLAKLQ